MTAAKPCPLTRFDNRWRKRWGVERIGGVDEAGRGPWAGPVVAACVVLEKGAKLPGLNDSKQLTHDKREELAPLIIERAAAWGLGWATAAEIDATNILIATHTAAGRAMDALAIQPEGLLTDYLKLKTFFGPIEIEALVDGDAKSQAIAAASVLAKVARDRIMIALDALYPVYGFARHKGYGGNTTHFAQLETHGASTLHRFSFRPLCERWPEAKVRAAWPAGAPPPGSFFAPGDALPGDGPQAEPEGAAPQTAPQKPRIPDWLHIMSTPTQDWDHACLAMLLPESELVV